MPGRKRVPPAKEQKDQKIVLSKMPAIEDAQAKWESFHGREHQNAASTNASARRTKMTANEKRLRPIETSSSDDESPKPTKRNKSTKKHIAKGTEDEKGAGSKKGGTKNSKKFKGDCSGDEEDEHRSAPAKKAKRVATNATKEAGNKRGDSEKSKRSQDCSSGDEDEDTHVPKRRKTKAKQADAESKAFGSKKHAPITPKGTILKRIDNLAFNESVFKQGKIEADRLVIQLKCTKGRSYTWIYPHRDSANWNDPAFISAVTKWLKQIINRTLDVGDKTVKIPRHPWSLLEKKALENTIQQFIRNNPGKKKLVAADWDTIAKSFNKVAKGKKLVQNAVLPPSKNSKGQPTPAGKNKSERILGERSQTGIRTQIGRWDDTRQKVNSLLAHAAHLSPEDADEKDEEGSDDEGLSVSDSSESSDDDEAPKPAIISTADANATVEASA